MAEAGSGDLGKTSSGMQPNFAALLSYVLGLVTGLVFFFLEKGNPFVKFHAMQSICFSLALSALSVSLLFLPVIGWLMLPLLQLGALVLWVILMIQAYHGKWFRVPVIGDFAAKQAGI